MNMSKMQFMICTPGQIWMQLLTESYRWMQHGWVMASEWNSPDVEFWHCGMLKASSLGRHLADIYDIYQQAVVAEELLEVHLPILYMVNEMPYPGALSCLHPGCEGHLWDGWIMWRHFRDVHPLDLVKVLKQGHFNRCKQCRMQVHFAYPQHRLSKECQIGVEQKQQWETAVALALALWQQFLV